MALEALFISALDADAAPYAYGVFSTHYRLRGGIALEYYFRAEVARGTVGDQLRYAFRDETGARAAALRIRAAFFDAPQPETDGAACRGI